MLLYYDLLDSTIGVMSSLFGIVNSIRPLCILLRMRWRSVGLRKSRCIGENPVFPQVIYQKEAWIFVTCLEQMLAQRCPLSRDTECFQKKIN